MTEIEAEVSGSQVREIDRVGAFTDGVMAIAITLLVLNLHVPHVASHDSTALRHGLLKLGPDLFAYAISFAVIGRYWILHHRFIAVLRGYDLLLILINLVFLGFVVLIPFAAEVLGRYGHLAPAAITYALVLTAVATTNVLLVRYSLSQGFVAPAAASQATPFADLYGFLTVGIFAGSIPLALLSPRAAEISWFVVILARTPFLYRRTRRH